MLCLPSAFLEITGSTLQLHHILREASVISERMLQYFRSTVRGLQGALVLG